MDSNDGLLVLLSLMIVGLAWLTERVLTLNENFKRLLDSQLKTVDVVKKLAQSLQQVK